jgi:hypothetical protein
MNSGNQGILVTLDDRMILMRDHESLGIRSLRLPKMCVEFRTFLMFMGRRLVSEWIFVQRIQDSIAQV